MLALTIDEFFYELFNSFFNILVVYFSSSFFRFSIGKFEDFKSIEDNMNMESFIAMVNRCTVFELLKLNVYDKFIWHNAEVILCCNSSFL